jgi:hypothetical protein
VRVVRFRAPHTTTLEMGATQEVAVMYLFHVNDEFKTTRDGVRVALSNPLQRYAYYAKIEVTFTDDSTKRMADADASVAALGPLMDAVLPVLFEDHFNLALLSGAESAAQPSE